MVLLLVWAVPVVFTGLLSRVSYLGGLVPWLHWINSIPAWLLGCIQGVLPQILLTALTTLLPYVLRMLTESRALLTEVAVEQSLQKSYFTFLFVQVFLTVSLASSAPAIIQQTLHSVDSIPEILATNLPKASNYFLSYLLMQCFTVSASSLLQVGRLASWCISLGFSKGTPREQWKKQTRLPQMQWGTVFPIYTNLACIGKSYTTRLAQAYRVRHHLFRCGTVDSLARLHRFRFAYHILPLQSTLRCHIQT